MKSASEHREAESRLQEATPPRVSESSEEVTASVLSRANVASVQQSEPESEEGEESEEEPEEQLEEEKETEAEGVPGSDRFSLQVKKSIQEARDWSKVKKLVSSSTRTEFFLLPVQCCFLIRLFY